MDVDGDGRSDLDARCYAGQWFGGIDGTMLLLNIQAGAPMYPGWSDSGVWGAFRFLTAIALASRQPALLNLPTSLRPAYYGLRFEGKNMPLRNAPPVVNTVPGAMAIAEVLERNEWVQQSGNPAVLQMRR